MYLIKSIAASAVIATSFIGSGCTFESTKQVTEQKFVVQEPDIVKYAIGLKDPSDPKGTIDDYIAEGHSSADAWKIFPNHTVDQYKKIKTLALEHLAKYPEIKIEEKQHTDNTLRVSSKKTDFENLYHTKLTWDLGNGFPEDLRNEQGVYMWFTSRKIVVPEGIEDITLFIQIYAVYPIKPLNK